MIKYTKALLLTVSTLFLTAFLYSQNHNIRGFVYDKSNGEPMPFEKVRLLKASDKSTVTGAVTDVNGFFSMAKVAKGEYIVRVENFAYKVAEEKVSVKGDGITDLKFQLEKREDIKQIEEVSVSAESRQKKNEVLVSKISLDKKSIERIPSIGSENDIIGAFSVTPGVTTTGDQGGQLYVRGGTPIQNKTLLDGITIYNPFHSIGFFSIFETELVKNVDIYTGGFDAKYGGRISSIMDITYRDGNRKKVSGKVSGSPFMAKAVLEGPIGKKSEDGISTGSYVLLGKHSLLDNTSRSLYPNVNDGNGLPFTFTDLYGKVTFNSDASKFSFFGFSNRDSVNYYDVANLTWKQSGGGMNFLLVPQASPLFMRGHVNFSNYEIGFQENETKPRTSSIGGFDMGFDFTYFLANQGEINYGFNFGGFSTNYITYNASNTEIQSQNFSTESGLYVNYRLVKNRWVVQPSARVQYYPSLGTVSPEPRLGLKYNATEKFRLKLSGGRFSQNFTSASSDRDVVNLFNGFLSAPDQSQVQSTFVNSFSQDKNVANGLQYAWHGIFGGEVDVTKRLSLNIEGYYKYFSQLSNINARKIYEDNDQFASQPDVLKKDFIIEDGQTYGVDVLLKYSKNRLFLWGVYSLAKSTRFDGFDTYFPVFDRRHNVNLVGTYVFGKKKDLELNIRWNLGSGLPFTPTAGFFQQEEFNSGVDSEYVNTNSDVISAELGNFNSERLPYYHRMDVTVKKQFKFKNKTTMELVASVTNVYDRRNIFYVNRVTQETIYQFPILPSFGLSYKF